MTSKQVTAAEASRVRDPSSGGGWLRRKIVAQFRRPSGLLGRLAGRIMATRSSNVHRNQETIRLLEIEPGDRVLEIGFGPAGAIAAGRVALRLGGVDGLAGEERGFDKVYTVNVFHFWPDPVAELRRIHACMADGARIAITHQPRHKQATNADAELAAERIAEALRQAGFTEISTRMIRMTPLDAACVLGRAERAGA